MALSDFFGFFDPCHPYSVSYRTLPHWEQVGATYFITFRLVDSIPDEALRRIRRGCDEWLARHGMLVDRGPWFANLMRASFERQREYFQDVMQAYERVLDRGYGECQLAKPGVASIVANSLLHFDGFVLRGESLPEWRDGTAKSHEIRYHCSDFVIMPNHVHALVCFRAGVRLLNQCSSWKGYTARAINRFLGRKGNVWQAESFDHLVRDADHFARIRAYIANNPRKANLPPDKFLHYQYSG